VNGRAWDTEDVNFSWERVKAISGDRNQISNEVNPDAPISSLTTPDDSTIVVKLAYPQSFLLGILARNFGAKLNMVPKETDTTFDIRRDMIGTGAYMLSNYQPSLAYEYKVNPDYYEPDHHYVETIRQPVISEYASGLAQFKAGNIDTWDVNPEDMLDVKAENPEIDLYQGPFAAVNLNTAFSYLPGSPFHDERVRQAYSMTIDRDLWIEVFYNVSNFEDQGLPVDTRWNSALQCTEEGWWVDPKSDAIGEGGKYFQRNPEEAKKLLEAAGHPDGLDFPVAFPTGSSAYGSEFVSQAEVLDQMMREVGFRAETHSMDYSSEFVPQYRDAIGQFEGMIYKVGTTIADDAVASLASRFASNAGTQFYGFDAKGSGDKSGDPQVDNLIAKAVAEVDTDARKGIVRQLEQYLATKQYLVRWPGGATGFEMAQPAVKNYLVYRGSAAGLTVGSRLAPYFWWLDRA
jgi:ABC-type transport system substrate-binding protein